MKYFKLTDIEFDYKRIAGEVINTLTNTTYYNNGILCDKPYNKPHITLDTAMYSYEFETTIVYVYSDITIDTIKLQALLLHLLIEDSIEFDEYVYTFKIRTTSDAKIYSYEVARNFSTQTLLISFILDIIMVAWAFLGAVYFVYRFNKPMARSSR